MRALTLEEVREVLSSPAASRFFDAWSRAAEARARAEERRDDLFAQVHSAESRVRFAEESARVAAERADDERRRALEPGLDPTMRRYVRLEADALARALLEKAHASIAEAHERRRRASAFSDEAEKAEAEVSEAKKALDLLRSEVSALGGYAGESCLFFEAASAGGGLWVVPLTALELKGRTLETYVLHHLRPDDDLSLSAPVRDLPEGGDDATAPDELETPHERVSGGRGS